MDNNVLRWESQRKNKFPTHNATWKLPASSGRKGKREVMLNVHMGKRQDNERIRPSVKSTLLL